MTRNDLYERALQYRKTKLWEKLRDTQVFAVKTDKETLFLCIMGALNEHIALAVYPEDEFYSYYEFLDLYEDMAGRTVADTFECMISSSCIQCSFEAKDMLRPDELTEARAYAKSHGIRFAGKNAYPQFSRFTPFHYPWNVQSQEDIDRLATGLEASIALFDELSHNPSFAAQLRDIDVSSVTEVPLLVRKEEGYKPDGTTPLPNRRTYVYPSGDYGNEIQLHQIRSKRKGKAIDCRVSWMNHPEQENPEDVPYYPAALIAVDEADGMIICVAVTPDYESGHDELLTKLMDALVQRKKRPAMVKAQDARTYALLKEAMEKASIELCQDNDLPLLDDAIKSMYEYVRTNEFPHDEDGEDSEDTDTTHGNPEDDLADLVEMEENLHRMLSELESMNDALLKGIPQEIIVLLSAISDTQDFSPAIRKRIDTLLSRINGIRQKNGKSGRSGKIGRKKAKAEAPLSYVISISPYTGCFRHIRVSADITLKKLHEIIQDVFQFDNDHLYAFFMDNKAWSHTDAYYSPGEPHGRRASKYKLRDLSLYKGKKFLYLFDFGDEWRFECRILREVEESTDGYQVLRSKGETPVQYGNDWDVEDWEFDDEDE